MYDDMRFACVAEDGMMSDMHSGHALSCQVCKSSELASYEDLFFAYWLSCFIAVL